MVYRVFKIQFIVLCFLFLLGCTGQKVDFGGMNFSLSKDDILVNKGESEALFAESSTSEIEFKALVELNQEIEIEVNLGELNSYISSPYPNSKTKIYLSKSQPNNKLSLSLTTVPASARQNEFKISLTAVNLSVRLSVDEIIVRIDSTPPQVSLATINSAAPGISAAGPALDNKFQLAGTCAGSTSIIHARKTLVMSPFYEEIPLRDVTGGPVKCVDSVWSSSFLDTSNLSTGTHNLFLIAVDSSQRESSPVSFSIVVDKDAPVFTSFDLNSLISDLNYVSIYNDSVPKILSIQAATAINPSNFSLSQIDTVTLNTNLTYTIYLSANTDGKSNPLVQKTLSSVFQSQAIRGTDFANTIPDGTYYVGLEIKDVAGNATLRVRTLNINSSVLSVNYVATDQPDGKKLKAGDIVYFYLYLNRDLEAGQTISSSQPKLGFGNTMSGRMANYNSYYSVNSKGVIKFEYTVQAGDNTSNFLVTSFTSGTGVFRDILGVTLTDKIFSSPLTTTIGSSVAISVDTIAPANPTFSKLTPAANVSNSRLTTLRLGGVAIGETSTVFSAAGCSAGNALAEVINSNTTQDVTLSGLAADFTFTFYAQEKDGAGNLSACVGPINYTTDNTPPPILISDIIQINRHREIPDIQWSSAATDLMRFEIAVASTSAGLAAVPDYYSWTNIGLATANGFALFKHDISGLQLTNGNSYYVGIRAYDQAGNMAQSNFLSPMLVNLSQHAYVKAFNSNDFDRFGKSISIQGNLIAVGAPDEDSNHTDPCNFSQYMTINLLRSACDNNLSQSSGAVYVYAKSGATWALESFLKSPLSHAGDAFGTALSLDQDRIAVGAPFDSRTSNLIEATLSIATNSSPDSGAVYIYKRNGTSWSLESIIKASNNTANNYFGFSVKLKGNTLIVGAPGANFSAGAAYVYKFSSGSWSEVAAIAPVFLAAGDSFGVVVDLSLTPTPHYVIGAPNDDSSGNTVSGDSFARNNLAFNSGAVYVYNEVEGDIQIANRIKASNADSGDYFGSSVAISDHSIVVGAPGERSSYNGIINGSTASTDNSYTQAGAAYVYSLNAAAEMWTQEAYLKTQEDMPGDTFGASVAIAGNKIIVGSPLSDDLSQSIGNEIYTTNKTCGTNFCNLGAAYLYSKTDVVWSQVNYLKASNAASSANYGHAVAIDVDGNIAVAAPFENSSTNSVVNSYYGDNSELGNSVGAIYIYKK